MLDGDSEINGYSVMVENKDFEINKPRSESSLSFAFYQLNDIGEVT